MKRKVGRPPAGHLGQKVQDYPQLSVRVPKETFDRLVVQCAQSGRNKSKEIEYRIENWDNTAVLASRDMDAVKAFARKDRSCVRAVLSHLIREEQIRRQKRRGEDG